MKCAKCQSENISVQVSLQACVPIKYYRKLTKGSFQKKECELWGAGWDTAVFLCNDCGYKWV